MITDKNPALILGGGETFAFVKTGKTTCGQYAMAEAVVAAGGGPPPHIHHHANEWFYFPNGGITLMHGSTLYQEMKDIPGVTAPQESLHLETVKPGSVYYSPKQYVHGFVNNSTEPRKLTFVWTPDEDKVGISNYFLAVGQKVLDRANPPAVNPENRARYVSEGPKYEINQSAHFWEYVDSVDYNFPKMESHLDELQALLAPDIEGGKGRNCK
ncbi:cupin domain-containing protein [Microcoleus sp. B5-D4]|uniref:cupin domain-containing protein n=1 Tax=unclassified Microcoleus TaxID=2642155 RepID=UPI002FD0FA79